MLNRFLSLALGLIFLLALLAIVLPLVLLVASEPFPLRLPFSLIFCAVALEKTWAMFSRAQGRKLLHVKHDWTTVSVGVTYTAVFYAVLIDFYARADGIPCLSVSVLGFILYGCALALRYWAFAHLGRQWAVHLDKELDAERKLISDGPYRLVRHPLYAGAMLETIGLSLAFNSFIALALGLATFIPLEMHRAYFEEKFLRELFGDEYSRYRSRVWAFFPLPFGKRSG